MTCGGDHSIGIDTMRRRLLLVGFLLACVSFMSPRLRATGDDAVPNEAATPPLNREQADKVVVQLDADQRVARVFAMCPADAFRTQQPVWRRLYAPANVPDADCARSPRSCLDSCLNWADSRSCFGLARAFQLNDELVPSRYAQMMFSMACATGLGAGCTNRGAAIRNTGDPGGPFNGPDPARERCEARSFTIGCGENDAWGCAMLGQSYQKGEGLPADPLQARLMYAKSCAISPSFAACRFATRRMKDLPQ